MFNTILLILAAGMVAWNVYRFIKRPDSVAFVTVLFWAVLVWLILAPLNWHISVVAGLLLLKVILTQRRHSRNRGDVLPGERLSEIDRPASERGGSARSIAPDDDELDDSIDSEEEDEALAKKEEVSLRTTPASGALAVRFAVKDPQTFPTTTGQSLKIEAGEHSGLLALSSPPSPQIDEALEEGYTARLTADFTYQEPAGQRWRCEKSLWVGDVLSIERLDGTDPQIEARFWSDAPPEMRRIFSDRCLVVGHPVGDDGRLRFPFIIGGRRVIVMTKYLSWKADLALDPDERRIWVRISELGEEIWDGDPFGTNPDASEWKDFKRVPAFYYPLPVEEFLPGINEKPVSGVLGEFERGEAEEDDDRTRFTPVENS